MLRPRRRRGSRRGWFCSRRFRSFRRRAGSPCSGRLDVLAVAGEHRDHVVDRHVLGALGHHDLGDRALVDRLDFHRRLVGLDFRDHVAGLDLVALFLERLVLRPYRWEILENVYRTAALECRARNVPSVWLLIPRVGKPIDANDRTRLVALAKNAPFTHVIDLSDAFDGANPSSLAIAPNDFHPNRRGHAQLARQLHAALMSWTDLQAMLEGSR